MLPSVPTAVAPRARGLDRTRGAAAVEAAIVLPVVLAVLLGTVEFGLIFKDSLAISSGVRAGARIAAADPTSGSLVDDAAAEVARSLAAASVSGTPEPALYVYDPAKASPPTCATQCVRLTWRPATKTFVRTGGSFDPCLGSGPGDVAVLVTVRHQALTGLGFASPTLTEKADFAFVPTSGTTAC